MLPGWERRSVYGWHNSVFRNNKFCPAGGDQPVNLQGGGILLLGATHTLVAGNSVAGNTGKQINSGGIVVASAHALTGAATPTSTRSPATPPTVTIPPISSGTAPEPASGSPPTTARRRSHQGSVTDGGRHIGAGVPRTGTPALTPGQDQPRTRPALKGLPGLLPRQATRPRRPCWSVR